MAAPFHRLVVQAHGAIYYACTNGFVVPQNLSIGFFYDPMREDTVLCGGDDIAYRICNGRFADPPFQFNGGETCPVDLTLTRADDIGKHTGVYDCGTNSWIPIRELGDPAPNPQRLNEIPIVCLSKVLNDISTELTKTGSNAVVYIMACGITAKYTLHPTRIKVVDPLSGLSMPLLKYQTYQDYIKRGFTPDQSIHYAQLAHKNGGKRKTRIAKKRRNIKRTLKRAK